MSYDDCVRIERAENGYTVSMRDPAIVAKNQARELKSDYRAPYVDPTKEYVFPDLKGVMAFLTANLDKALPKGDYDTAFSVITTSDSDEDD